MCRLEQFCRLGFCHKVVSMKMFSFSGFYFTFLTIVSWFRLHTFQFSSLVYLLSILYIIFTCIHACMENNLCMMENNFLHMRKTMGKKQWQEGVFQSLRVKSRFQAVLWRLGIRVTGGQNNLLQKSLQCFQISEHCPHI